MMMRRALLLVAVGVTVLALAVGTALATPPSG
jgi:quercetin dioxygenase-like cupin family protein